MGEFEGHRYSGENRAFRRKIRNRDSADMSKRGDGGGQRGSKKIDHNRKTSSAKQRGEEVGVQDGAHDRKEKAKVGRVADE